MRTKETQIEADPSAGSISNLARQVLKCREQKRRKTGTTAGQLRHKQEELELHFGKM